MGATWARLVNPLRILADWFGRPPPPNRPRADGCSSVGACRHCGSRGSGECRLLPLDPQWRHLMRHDGTDCHIPDHHDALQRLGQATIRTGQLEQQLRVLRADRDEAVADLGGWRTRALTAEAKLRDPSAGEQAA